MQGDHDMLSILKIYLLSYFLEKSITPVFRNHIPFHSLLKTTKQKILKQREEHNILFHFQPHFTFSTLL